MGRIEGAQRTGPRSPLAWWGDVVVRHPWWMLLLPIVLAIALVPVAYMATDNLSASGWIPDSAEAQRVQTIVEDEFGQAGNSHFILFSDPTGTLTPQDREFRLSVEQAVRPFRADPSVAAVYTWGTTSNETLNNILLSEDGTRSLAVIVLDDTPDTASVTFEHLEQNLVETPLDARVGGWPATTTAFLDVAEGDLVRAEIISIPVTLILLLVIFGGAVAASLPVVLAVLSMTFAFGFMWTMAQVTLVSTFSVNAVTMLGLAVSIDYALMMITRFREEMVHQDVDGAVRKTMHTAGRAVIGAGATVAIGLSGLMLFRVPAAVSTGIIGGTIVIIAVVLSLTFLPATFALFGRHIGVRRRLPIPFPPWMRTMWTAVQRWRVQYPLATVILAAAVLLILALPAARLEGSSPTISSLPRSTEARQVADEIAADFPHATLSPIAIVIQPVDKSMYSADNLQALQDYVAILNQHPDIDRAESIFSLLPRAMSPSTYATSLVLEPELARVSTPYLTQRAALVNITAAAGLSDDGQRELVRELRTAAPAMAGGDLDVLIGGNVGMNVDVMAFAADNMPGVVAYIVTLTGIALLVQLRSVFLPIKAIAMNLLSIGASFGALVWIFQEGHLSHLLRFEATGTTVILVPILMFCFLFGLSMDFEVIMLSRIRETWEETGDNHLAVEYGLRRTAGIVSSSAVVMLAVFLAFSTSELDMIKALGIGLAIAVIIEATIVRLILLPATMQLMGHWNWWLPFSQRKNRQATTLPEPAD